MVKPWVVALAGSCVDELEGSLELGPVIDDEGHRLLTEARVGAFGGFKVEIFADEHPPPHFRVSYAGQSATYRISDGTKLSGGLDRYQRNIRIWFELNRPHLVTEWNRLRPTDCPVGPIHDYP